MAHTTAPGTEPGADERGKRLALLIDADNAQANVIEGLLEEVATLGEAIVRRIYGDFTSTGANQWKKLLNKHSIKPVQQFAYTTGKNATDGTMIIDAMDLLYSRKFDGFCLVSSDSDFTGLAVRLREEGLLVYGFGREGTPEAFRNACNRFIFIEVLRGAQAKAVTRDPAAAPKAAGAARPRAAAAKQAGTQAAPKAAPARTARAATRAKAGAPGEGTPDSPSTLAQLDAAIVDALLLDAVARTGDDGGWSSLSAVGSYLRKVKPDFDPRLYGFKRLSDLARGKAGLLEVQDRPVPGGAGKVTYVRARERKASPAG